MNTQAALGHSFEMPALPSMSLDAPALGLASPSGEDGVLARLLSGEMSAVGEVYDRHHEVIRRFARRLLGDASEAEDLVQEVFVRLPSIVKNFRGEASFRQFLIGVTARLGRHHVRNACRRRELDERNETERSLVRGTSPPPDVESERRELADILTRALDTLSFDHRVVFVLSEVEHQTSREIAAAVGVPEGTVRTRLLHAKRNLRAYLAKEGLP